MQKLPFSSAPNYLKVNEWTFVMCKQDGDDLSQTLWDAIPPDTLIGTLITSQKGNTRSDKYKPVDRISSGLLSIWQVYMTFHFKKLTFPLNTFSIP